ncbi:MAG TPA: SDR family NAD(P)-dependent oxidoreductase [Chthoniobacteraceae bacterium]|nr:SDR family NAD(P)-dependent oxidoreductase [Chthoniobacteraceae bacterium]
MSVAIDLAGKVALITGASQGIGAQIARTFHEAGATVVLNHPDTGSTHDDAEKLAAALNASRAESAAVIAADVANADAVETMMRGIGQRFGELDFLINNAAILRDRTLANMSLDEWHSVIGVDLTGVFHCCKFGLEIMRDGGAIVNMGSIAAMLGFFGQSNYAAAKGGVLAMTRVLSRECARRSIRVNAIAPGVIKTAMAETIPENVRAEMMKQIPLARLGRAAEVASVALFLCSPLASYVTGQTIGVNGGWHG